MSVERRRVKKAKLSEELKRHSPIKTGVIYVKNEDDPYEDISKIMSNLYVGNYNAAQSKRVMKKYGIEAVLNCTKKKDLPHYFRDHQTHEIEYMRIPVDDSLKQKDFDKMYLLIPSAVEFIHKHVDILKQPLLVHCWAGRMRSITAVVCYLMAYHNMTPKQACKYVLQKRKEAFHFGLSINFDQTILKYYDDLKKCKKLNI